MCFRYYRDVPDIGHGQFYLEKIGLSNQEVNIIYDCGTKNEQNKLESEIEEYKFANNVVLSISHFHDDHINGIQKLKQKTKIKAVIIPKLTHREKVILSCLSDNDDVRGLIWNPSEYFYGSRIIQISPTGDRNEPRPPIVLSRLIETSSEAITDISHHQEVSILNDDICNWILKTYVKPIIFASLSKPELDELDNFNIDSFDDKNKINKIKGIYNRISNKNLNKTSMIIASYCNCNIKYQELPFECYCYLQKPLPGTLYTGDYKIGSFYTANAIFSHFQDIYMKIFSMSIPHHGTDAYCKILPLPFIRHAFLQAGQNNQYNLPSRTLLDRFQTLMIKIDREY